MRHVREILRLGCTGISGHEIARRTGLAPSTVRETVKRFEASGLTWPLPDKVTDGALEAELYKNAGTKQGHRRQVEPDWAIVHRELKRTGMRHPQLSPYRDHRGRRATTSVGGGDQCCPRNGGGTITLPPQF
jgi:transposase